MALVELEAPTVPAMALKATALYLAQLLLLAVAAGVLAMRGQLAMEDQEALAVALADKMLPSQAALATHHLHRLHRETTAAIILALAATK